MKLKIHYLKHQTTKLGHLAEMERSTGYSIAEPSTPLNCSPIATVAAAATAASPSTQQPIESLPDTYTAIGRQQLDTGKAQEFSGTFQTGGGGGNMLPPNITAQEMVDMTLTNLHMAHLAYYHHRNSLYYQLYPYLNAQGGPMLSPPSPPPSAAGIATNLTKMGLHSQLADDSLYGGGRSSSSSVHKTPPPSQPHFDGMPINAKQSMAFPYGGGSRFDIAASADKLRLPSPGPATLLLTGKRKYDEIATDPTTTMYVTAAAAKKVARSIKATTTTATTTTTMATVATTAAAGNFKMFKDEPIPHGYLKFRFNEDCNFHNCGYRNHQSHFHCCRTDCYYSFCDKTRFVQHTARHERLDKLMGEDFKQYRANMRCGYEECAYNKNMGE